MKKQLEHFIHLNLKNPKLEEIDEILKIFKHKHYKKGDFFKKYDMVCNELAFIIDGCAKHFIINNNGDEITSKITQKNNFISEIISVRTNGKTPIALTFIEDTEVLVANFSDIRVLLETNLTLNRIIREYMADQVAELLKLYILFLTGYASDRYHFILNNNPDLLEKFPQHFIASMIGVTPTQLSRIRKK